MRPATFRLVAPVFLLLLCAASCRDGYESTSGGYYYDGPSGKSYLELSDSLYKGCDLLVDGSRPSTWGNRRTKLSPGTHEVRCDPRPGSIVSSSRMTVELRAGKVLHLDTIW